MIKIKKNLMFWGFGGLFILVILGLIFGLNQYAISVTGATISVEYYGVSDELRSFDAGKMQTYVELDKAAVKKILLPAERVKLAEEILLKVDFTEGLVELYQNDPPAPLPAGALAAVREGASKENDNFLQDQPCFYKVATDNQYDMGDFKLALISELKYQDCSGGKYWLFAFARHTFFDYDEGGYICGEDGRKLFLVHKETGEINTDVSGC